MEGSENRSSREHLKDNKISAIWVLLGVALAWIYRCPPSDVCAGCDIMQNKQIYAKYAGQKTMSLFLNWTK